MWPFATRVRANDEQYDKSPTTITFANIDEFVDESKDVGIRQVRLDTITKWRDSELSFLKYVSSVVVVTAVHPVRHTVYEYVESVITTIQSDDELHPEDVHCTEQRLLELREQLVRAGFEVRRGRIAPV